MNTFQQDKLSDYCKLLSSNDYPTTDLLKVAVELKLAYGLKSHEVFKLTGVKKDSLRRGVEARLLGRDIGRNGPPRKFSTKEEELIMAQVISKMENGEDMSYKSIKLIAKSVWIDEHGHNLQLEAPDLGEKIIRTWLKKRGLTLQKPRKLEPERFLTIGIVSAFVERYNQLVTEYGIHPRLRFNLDEIWLDENADHHKSVAYKAGSNPIIEAPPKIAEHATLAFCMNAVGHKFKSTCILPLKTLPPLCDDVLDTFNITGSEDGWMTSHILKNVVEHIFIKELQEYRKKYKMENDYALLLLDNHSSRVSLDEESLKEQHKLIVLYIPPHSSALLQPLDLCPNNVFKTNYFKYKSDPDIIAKDTRQEQRNFELQAAVLAESIALARGNIIQGWVATGLLSDKKTPGGIVLADLDKIKGSKMIVWPYEPLPSVAEKRKRGQHFETGGDYDRNEGMINSNDPSEKELKRYKKKENLIETVDLSP